MFQTGVILGTFRQHIFNNRPYCLFSSETSLNVLPVKLFRFKNLILLNNIDVHFYLINLMLKVAKQKIFK